MAEKAWQRVTPYPLSVSREERILYPASVLLFVQHEIPAHGMCYPHLERVFLY